MVLIYKKSASQEATEEMCYTRALAFVDTVEPMARGGLARAYRTRAGETLNTLEEVVRALLAGELA